jgi:hypothetical protein
MYISVVLYSVSVSFTYLNIVIANPATIYPVLETHEVEQSVFELCPGNKFESEKFEPLYSNMSSSYLNLIVVNDGAGVAKLN